MNSQFNEKTGDYEKITKTEMIYLMGCYNGTPLFRVKPNPQRHRIISSKGGAQQRMFRRMIEKGLLSKEYHLTDKSVKIIKKKLERRRLKPREGIHAVE